MLALSQKEQEKSMMQWHPWRDQLGDHILDFGNMFFNGMAINAKGAKLSDGLTIGYSRIKAKDQEQAISLTARHPHIQWHAGAYIEILEYMKMP